MTTRSSFSPVPAHPVVAVAGATGAVGREMLLVLEQLAFPAREVRALSSARSVGTSVPYAGPGAPEGRELPVEEMTPESFEGVDIALFSAGGSVSQRFADAVVRAGAVMIDNSSAFRMDEGVPLVVPEVNPADALTHQGIIANPNCSTIQMVVALAPLHQLLPLKRVIADTYQAASGAGAKGMEELYEQSKALLTGQDWPPQTFAYQIAFNVIPQIDVFLDDGSTKEEWKMVVETQKILHAPEVAVQATCVRVPVLRSHSEAVHVQFDAAELPPLADIRAVLEAAPGIVVVDDPQTLSYPMPIDISGTDAIYVGRLRRDPTVDAGISFWVVADQLRKGAALNAVQIAQLLLPTGQ
ncbi:MAG: aspartate-semialdehyde dehydrogenase [Actinomycetes bacterium]|jgi:aspartate-semialdehyde dehydrogenase|nr:aspartate-semialdehyde dehydrogenase [Actinomycetes bacterium]